MKNLPPYSVQDRLGALGIKKTLAFTHKKKDLFFYRIKKKRKNQRPINIINDFMNYSSSIPVLFKGFHVGSSDIVVNND
jgi:hypothetical protein